MDRRVRVLGAAGVTLGVVILAAFSAGFLPPFDPINPPTFTWTAHTNDILAYEILVYRGMGDEISWYDDLNQSTIRFNITSLPNVEGIVDSTQFTEMVETLKIDILPPVLNENGTEVNSSAIDLIHRIASKTILPVDGWSFIDNFYADSGEPSDCGFSCNHYYSILADETFIFGHLYFNIDAGSGWYATMNTATGLPSEIVWWTDDFIIHRHYQIVMTPVTIV
ncbi:MAG: hypothetical protein ACXAAO_11185 [Candidatus Thorarchaeota archaeon]|jgi:hypothetical protein